MHTVISVVKCDGCGEEQDVPGKSKMGENFPGMLLVEINGIRHDLCEKNGCADKLRKLVSANDAEREKGMTR